MLTKVSKHLQKLAAKSSAIKKQFYPSAKEDQWSHRSFIDPLLEEKNKKTRGLVHKYPKRVLIELTTACAAYCRFCTRRREVSDIKKGTHTKADIEKMIQYVKSNSSINEIIFSGGDPLVVRDLLIYALKKFNALPQIKIIRIHSRVPVSDPRLVSKDLLKLITNINKNKAVFFSIHFEHPDEITPQTIKMVKALKQTGAVLLSQSVFLRGVNDSVNVLGTLFSRLSELGIRPYYIYHCDLVRGVEHFIVPIKKEIQIMTELRKRLSGIAFPIHAVDTPNGAGKIPVPLGFWKADLSSFTDFHGKKIEMY